MKQISLSEICTMYGFTRRVIQGYEKEGLIKHSSKNKYGYLMYDENEVKKIAYIRYLQKNGWTLKEISELAKDGLGCNALVFALNKSNAKHKKEIKRKTKLIRKNEKILALCTNSNLDKKENEVFQIIMEEFKDEKTI